MTAAAARRLAWVAVAALLVAGCTAAPEPSPDSSIVAPVYVEDPEEIADLRAAAGLALCPDTDADGGAPARRGNPGLPDLTLPCLGEGPDVNLSELGGTPYVVNVWAGWCGPCREEMPHFEEVYAQADGRVGIVGVDFEDTTIGGLSAAADFGITFPSVQDLDGATRLALRFQGPPFTAFVAADGTVAATKSGVVTSADELRGLIEKHLGVAL